ncbi:MAG: ferritin-like domain-containing protein [Gemmataceae bacterium]
MSNDAAFRRVRFEWIPPAAVAVAPLALTDAANRAVTAPGPRTANEIMGLLRELGHVEVIGADTPKDELLALLQLAAEVEHALLVQYVYAAASLTPNSGPYLKIMDVAIQEMAHLISVENLLLAVGGQSVFHIGRDNFRAMNTENPLPLSREPVSWLTLAEYVLAESPLLIPPDNPAAARVTQLKVQVKQQAGLEPHHVAAIYAKIYWILQPSDATFGPLSLKPDPANGFPPGRHIKPEEFTSATVIQVHQADANEWNPTGRPNLLILQSNDALTAVAAVDNIMRQGEGLEHAAESHFYDFLGLLDEFNQGQIPVLATPKNPYVGRLPPDVKVGSAIKHPYARLWANLFNVRYSAVLLSIGHALLTPRDSSDRATVVDLAFECMKRDLSALIAQMNSPVLRALDVNSGPTFELLREDMPPSVPDCWRRQSELLNIERKVRAELSARPELADDADGKVLFDDLKSSWQERRDLVDGHLHPIP